MQEEFTGFPLSKVPHARTIIVVLLLLAFWMTYQEHSKLPPQPLMPAVQASVNDAVAPSFMHKGARFRAITESTQGQEVVVQDVQGSWVLVELVLPQLPGNVESPDGGSNWKADSLLKTRLRWINLNTEKGYWIPLDDKASVDTSQP
jgi:hypothetical protein